MFIGAVIKSATDYWPSYSPLAHGIASLSWAQSLAGWQFLMCRIIRYGFNGKENNNEWNSVMGGIVDFGTRNLFIITIILL